MNNLKVSDSGCKYKAVRWEPLTKEEREEIDKFYSISSEPLKSSSDRTSCMTQTMTSRITPE